MTYLSYDRQGHLKGVNLGGGAAIVAWTGGLADNIWTGDESSGRDCLHAIDPSWHVGYHKIPMKRFLTQALCVILIIVAIKVYKYRRHFDIFYPKEHSRAQAKLPRPVAIKRELPCGVMGKIPVLIGSEEILWETAIYNIKYLEGRWDSIWPVVEKAVLKEMREYDAV